VHKNRWVQTGATVSAVAVGSLLFITAAGGAIRPSSSVPFDLAIAEMNVKQLSSTPMFRTVEISCTVESRGPRISNGTAWLLMTRPGDAGPQVVSLVAIPRAMEPGSRFQARSQSFAWAATAIPYRCEIEFGGTYAMGDADPSNDFQEFTFPKL
jgi:hypothetical protein